MFRQPSVNNRSATIVPKPTIATLIRKVRWLNGVRVRKQTATPYRRNKSAVLGAIGIRSAPKQTSRGKSRIHPSSARRPVAAEAMPAVSRRKLKTSGYATRRSSFATAFIRAFDYEAMPVIGNLQTAIFSILCGASAHCHYRDGSARTRPIAPPDQLGTWNFAHETLVRFAPENRAVGAIGGGDAELRIREDGLNGCHRVRRPA